MTRRDRRKCVGGGFDQTIDRAEAARLLREVRSAGEDRIDEAIEWAFAALPERKHVRRLAVQRHLENGNTEMADALAAQGLLLRPTDPSLAMLRARSLLMQGEPRGADREIELVLSQRPNHCATLLLAAEIAFVLKDYPRAISLLHRADRVKPNRDDIAALQVQTLIDADCVKRASTVLDSMRKPSPVLRARLLKAQGRVLEAVELLAGQTEAGASAGDVEITHELIDLLERLGNHPRLSSVLLKVGPDQPEVLVRAGAGWLSLGWFATAVLHLAPLRNVGRYRRDALAVITVAASMLGRMRLAELALARLQQTPSGADPIEMAHLWRRALTARLFSDQCNPQQAGADRNASLLQPLLRTAVEVFASQPRTRPGVMRGAGGADIQRHRATCLAAMGRTKEATEALSKMLAPEVVEPKAQPEADVSLRRAA